jgi:hypothetical protein
MVIGVYLQDTASLYDKHTTIAPPIAKVQLPVTTATPMDAEASQDEDSKI